MNNLLKQICPFLFQFKIYYTNNGKVNDNTVALKNSSKRYQKSLNNEKEIDTS